MQVAVIGGTGHIGGFLVPQLVELGCEVVVATRGRRPKPAGKAWERVRLLALPAERAPAFLAQQKPDVLIDIVQQQATGYYEAMRGRVRQFIWCGSLWMLGPPAVVPTPEVRFGPALVEGYQRRVEELVELQHRCRRDGAAFTAILPPNIAGPGKVPLDPAGGRSVEVHRSLAGGEAVTLFEGCNTLIGPCDAEDVAAGFRLAVERPDAATGEMFNVGSEHALTAEQLVAVYADIYGVHIPVRTVPFETFCREVVPDAAARNHFIHHMCPDITKARRKLGYRPRHSPAEALARAVEWMRGEGLLD